MFNVTIFSNICLAQEKNFFAVPLKLEGLGVVLGAGFQYKSELEKEFIIGVGIAERKQSAWGTLVKIPLPLGKSFISASLFQAQDLKIPSTYTRGSKKAELFYNKTSLSGLIFGGGVDFDLTTRNKLKLNLSFGTIEQQFKGFLTEDFQEIKISNNLGNLNSNLQNFGISYSFQQYPEKVLPERGWKIYSQIKSSTQKTNTFYSGTTKLDYALDIHIPLFRSLYIVPRFFYGTVSVVQPEVSDVSGENGLKTHFRDLCPTDAFECDSLETNLVKNLSQHNKYGTATSLGGSQFLRSEPLFRYKGSKTEYSALEIRYPFYLSKTLMEPIFFVERGRSYDQQVKTQDNSFIVVNGIEYRFHISEELIYKIVYAVSNRGEIAFQLAVGSTW